MASSIANTIRARPLLVSAAVATGLAATYYTSNRRPLRLDAAGSMPATTTFSFPKSMMFARELTVTKVEQINHDTKRVTFSLPGGTNEATGVPAGGAILTQHTPQGAWFPVFRPYTPVHDTESNGELELVVKKYPNGRASGFIHSLVPGSKMTVRGPLPGYTWKASAQPRDVLFIAGGAGITPLFSLARAIVKDDTDKTRVKLIWGVNGTRDIVLKEELEDLERKYPEKLKVTYVVSGSEAKADAPSLGEASKWRKGYIDSSLLQESIKQLEAGSFGDEKGTKVFFCGPPAMQTALTGSNGTLSQLGISKKAQHLF